MTQKELLYYEDSIGHEDNIIKILNESINYVESEEIRSFLDEEINVHNTLKENLLDLLESEVND